MARASTMRVGRLPASGRASGKTTKPNRRTSATAVTMRNTVCTTLEARGSSSASSVAAADWPAMPRKKSHSVLRKVSRSCGRTRSSAPAATKAMSASQPRAVKSTLSISEVPGEGVQGRCRAQGGAHKVQSAAGPVRMLGLVAGIKLGKTHFWGDSSAAQVGTTGTLTRFRPRTKRSVTMALRILIADDHAVVADGVRYLLAAQSDLEVGGTAADGTEAVQLAQELAPDVILLDIVMPQLNGIDAAREIVRRNPEARVIMLSMYSDSERVYQSLQVGARGYV